MPATLPEMSACFQFGNTHLHFKQHLHRGGGAGGEKALPAHIGRFSQHFPSR